MAAIFSLNDKKNAHHVKKKKNKKMIFMRILKALMKSVG